jgi:hypothetical protein
MEPQIPGRSIPKVVRPNQAMNWACHYYKQRFPPSDACVAGSKRFLWIFTGISIFLVLGVTCMHLLSPSTTSTAPVLLGQDGTDDAAEGLSPCSGSDDPVECLERHRRSSHRYWTKGEVNEELYKTMKGLAELEVGICLFTCSVTPYACIPSSILPALMQNSCLTANAGPVSCHADEVFGEPCASWENAARQGKNALIPSEAPPQGNA